MALPRDIDDRIDAHDVDAGAHAAIIAAAVAAAVAAAEAALAAHEAASDPHAGYQKESEKDAANGYLGADANARLTSTKIQVSATDRFIGRDSVGAGASEEITPTAATAMLDAFTGDSGAGGVKGMVPAPAAGDAAAGKFLKADGTWATPSAAGFEFPVGYMLVSVVNTNPNTFLGYGTWSNVGAGRVLVGLDSGDTDFDTAEETGGAKTKAISAHAGTAVANHSDHVHSGPADHASHTHDYTQVPNHVHVQQLPSTQAGNFACGTRDTSSGGTGGTPGVVDDALSTKNPTGGVATGTTQGPSAALSHGNTGNPTAALTHSVTQPSDHSALNVVQPYLVVYFWKRTA